MCSANKQPGTLSEANGGLLHIGAVIEDLGLMPLLDTVLLSEEEGVEKPSCAIFQRACERLGVKPEETVHVGDELDWYVAPPVYLGWYSNALIPAHSPPATTRARRLAGCKRCLCVGLDQKVKRSGRKPEKT